MGFKRKELNADYLDGLTSTDFALASHNHNTSDINAGTLVHERGGLEADVSAYSGLLKVSGGATSQIADNSTNWDTAYTHSQGDGSDHADVVTNTAGIVTNVSAIALNTTHRSSNGTDHANMVLNDTHRGAVDAINGLVKCDGAGGFSAGAGDTDFQQVVTWGDGLKYTGGTADVDFNSTNLKVTANQINTIQNINTGASPTFAGLTVNGSIYGYYNNLLVDGSFEEGLTFWNYDGTQPTIDTVVKQQGTQSIKFTASLSVIYSREYIPVQVGQTVRASCWAKTDSVVDGALSYNDFNMCLQFFDKNFNQVAWWAPLSLDGTHDWTKYTSTRTVLSGEVYVRLCRLGLYAAASGTAWVDNCKLEVRPYPQARNNIGNLWVRNGRVGVDQRNPDNLLHVGGSTDASVLPVATYPGIIINTPNYSHISTLNATSNVETGMLAHSASGIMGTWTNHPLWIRTNNEDRITISSAGAVSIVKDLTAGSTSRAADTYIRVLADDAHKAGFEAYGNSQGTGYLYVGQASNYGGGIFYNGDGSPAFATGESADKISFYRKSNGINEVVFYYSYNSNNVVFRGNLTVASPVLNTSISGTAFLDEDDMVSNSAVKVASQQSIKAYAIQDTNNIIKDTHIDWGTGASQVSADDVPDGAVNAIITTTQETNFEAAYTHSQDNSQAHSDYLLNNANDSTTGSLTIEGNLIIHNGLYNTANKELIQGGDVTDWLRIGQDGGFTKGAAIYTNIATNGGLCVGSWEKPPAGHIRAKSSANGTSWIEADSKGAYTSGLFLKHEGNCKWGFWKNTSNHLVLHNYGQSVEVFNVLTSSNRVRFTANVAIGVNEPQAGYELTVSNDIYAHGNVSALTFTDRTKGWTGTHKEALTAILKIKNNKENNIDHDTLPDFTRHIKEGGTYIGADGETQEFKTEISRDLGAMITLLVESTKSLEQRIKLLESV